MVPVSVNKHQEFSRHKRLPFIRVRGKSFKGRYNCFWQYNSMKLGNSFLLDNFLSIILVHQSRCSVWQDESSYWCHSLSRKTQIFQGTNVFHKSFDFVENPMGIELIVFESKTWWSCGVPYLSITRCSSHNSLLFARRGLSRLLQLVLLSSSAFNATCLIVVFHQATVGRICITNTMTWHQLILTMSS